MSAPAPSQLTNGSSTSAAPHSTSVKVLSKLDCSQCRLPYSLFEGPRYPRVIVPCAHTFCTSCIDKHIKARQEKGHKLTCISHNEPIQDSLAYHIVNATDCEPNLQLLELMKLVEKDADYSVVATTCSECDAAAVVYCKNDDACFCEEHNKSAHALNAQKKHEIVPVQLRHELVIPKCEQHKSKDLDFYCQACEQLCCYMCTTVGEHKSCATLDFVVATGDHATISKANVTACRKKLEDITKVLSQRRDHCVDSNRDLSVDVEVALSDIARAEKQLQTLLTRRMDELRNQVTLASQAGAKQVDLLLGELTTNLCSTEAFEEEASRLLKMNDHALVKHTKALQNRVETTTNNINTLLASDRRLPLKFGVTFPFDRLYVMESEMDVYGHTDMSWQHMDRKEIPREVKQPSVSATEKQFQGKIESHVKWREETQRKVQRLSEAVVELFRDRISCDNNCEASKGWDCTTTISRSCYTNQLTSSAPLSPRMHAWRYKSHKASTSALDSQALHRVIECLGLYQDELSFSYQSISTP